jgi:hypothetical protein
MGRRNEYNCEPVHTGLPLNLRLADHFDSPGVISSQPTPRGHDLNVQALRTGRHGVCPENLSRIVRSNVSAIYDATDAAPKSCETAIRHAVWQLTSHFESRRKRNPQTSITIPLKGGYLNHEHTPLPHETLQPRNDCSVCCGAWLERAQSP